jgi:hypothetical protein
MKVNWGTGIVISFILFIGFIMVMVLQMSLSKKADHQMVTDSYYEKELAYQQQIDAQQRGLPYRINWERNENTWRIRLESPVTLNDSIKDFNLSFYRPSNKLLDFTISSSAHANEIEIPQAKLVPGKYELEARWTIGDKLFVKQEKYIHP